MLPQHQDGENADIATDLAQRARAGDVDAAAQLLEDSRGWLLTLFRQRLKRRVRQLHDPEDLLQEIALAVLRQNPEPVFASPAGFRAYLKRAAVRKAAEVNRRYRAGGKRDLERVVSLEQVTAQCKDDQERHAASPESLAAQREIWTQVVLCLKLDEHAVLAWYRLGCSLPEISRSFSCDLRHVRYLLTKSIGKMRSACEHRKPREAHTLVPLLV